MPRRYDSGDAKRRILSGSVRLFIEQGYSKTTMAEIASEANISTSTYHNIFQTKDGILMELVEFMFGNQFHIVNQIIGQNASPVLLYALETSIQLALVEQNENLREIYVEAYTNPAIYDYICHRTAAVLYQVFSTYMPGCSESDFYELDIGTAGMMRAYMSRPCDAYFPMERKLKCFLNMSLRAYQVPPSVQEEVISQVLRRNIRAISEHVIQRLFADLAMKFDFSLSGNPTSGTGT